MIKKNKSRKEFKIEKNKMKIKEIVQLWEKIKIKINNFPYYQVIKFLYKLN